MLYKAGQIHLHHVVVYHRDVIKFPKSSTQNRNKPLVYLHGNHAGVAHSQLLGKTADSGTYFKNKAFGIVGAVVCYILGDNSVCKKVLPEFLSEGDACISHQPLYDVQITKIHNILTVNFIKKGTSCEVPWS